MDIEKSYYKKKYFKYKRKNELYGGNNNDLNEELLINCYIASSHNTYLSGDQLKGNSDVSCYTNFIDKFKGGCVEIDVLQVVNRDGKDDVHVGHKSTLTSNIYLSDILKNIAEYISVNKPAMKGPVILSFDNKDIKKKEDHQKIWKIFGKYIGNLLYPIGDGFDITKVKVNNVKGRILLKWGQCANGVDDNCLALMKPPTSFEFGTDKNEFGTFGTDKKWVHFDKNNTISTHKPFHYPTNSNYNEINKFLISNKENFIRSYPVGQAVASGNYPIIPRLLHGINMVALNIQRLDRHTMMMNEIFRNGCIRKKPTRVISGIININDIQNYNVTISSMPTSILEQITNMSVIHPNGKTEITPTNKIIQLKNVHKDFLIIYIKCIYNGSDYRGAVELNVNDEVTCTLRNLKSSSGSILKKDTLTCNWDSSTLKSIRLTLYTSTSMITQHQPNMEPKKRSSSGSITPL